MGLTYIQDPHYRCRSMQERTGFYQRHSGEAIENDKTGRSDTGKETTCHVLIKVLQAIEKRIGAKLVPEILENVTTPEQYELLEMSKISGFVDRARGTGRPTKKDRRSMEEFITPEYFGDDDFDFEFDFEEKE
mgnify:CR=1 FL=1